MNRESGIIHSIKSLFFSFTSLIRIQSVSVCTKKEDVLILKEKPRLITPPLLSVNDIVYEFGNPLCWRDLGHSMHTMFSNFSFLKSLFLVSHEVAYLATAWYFHRIKNQESRVSYSAVASLTLVPASDTWETTKESWKVDNGWQDQLIIWASRGNCDVCRLF